MPVTSADISGTYKKVLDALTAFEAFLKTLNLADLKKIIDQVKQHVPQVGTVVTELIALLKELQKAVDSATTASLLTGVASIEAFAKAASPVLLAAEAIIPAQKSNIDDVLNVTSLVASFPDLKQLKDDIDKVIALLIVDLQSLQ